MNVKQRKVDQYKAEAEEQRTQTDEQTRQTQEAHHHAQLAPQSTHFYALTIITFHHQIFVTMVELNGIADKNCSCPEPSL